MTNDQHWRKRETKMIDVTSIKIEERILKPNKARIAAMAKSLKSDLGQLNPILITKHLLAWRVVAGATRLMAAQELGWDQIEATIIGADNEFEYKLIEIAENFDRHDLSEAERKRLKDTDKELRAQRLVHFERLAAGDNGPVGVAPPKKAKGGRGRKAGVRDAARKAGVPLATAQRKLTQSEKRVSLGTDAPSEEALLRPRNQSASQRRGLKHRSQPR
jgi:ParB-like chromosome segregation protein Spo0J